MKGREKVERALSEEGSLRIPCVICYEEGVIQDHWDELTSKPWWHLYSPVIEEQLSWRREVIDKLGPEKHL